MALRMRVISLIGGTLGGRRLRWQHFSRPRSRLPGYSSLDELCEVVRRADGREGRDVTDANSGRGRMGTLLGKRSALSWWRPSRRADRAPAGGPAPARDPPA